MPGRHVVGEGTPTTSWVVFFVTDLSTLPRCLRECEGLYELSQRHLQVSQHREEQFAGNPRVLGGVVVCARQTG